MAKKYGRKTTSPAEDRMRADRINEQNNKPTMKKQLEGANERSAARQAERASMTNSDPYNKNNALPKERRSGGRRDLTSDNDRLFDKPEPKTGNDAMRARAESLTQDQTDYKTRSPSEKEALKKTFAKADTPRRNPYDWNQGKQKPPSSTGARASAGAAGAGRAASAARIAGTVGRVAGAAGAVALAGQAGYAVGGKIYAANQSSIQDYLDDVRAGGKKPNYSGVQKKPKK